jgi:1,2-phenylacetyl-CoA epoxidase catalytic subunit
MRLFTTKEADFSSDAYKKARLHYLIQIIFGESMAINYCRTMATFAPTEEAKAFLLKQQEDEDNHLDWLTEAVAKMERPPVRISHNMRQLHENMEQALADKDYPLCILIQNFIVEGLVITLLEELQKHGDPILSNVCARIVADEIRHVQFGVDELKRIIAEGDKKVYNKLITTQRVSLFYSLRLFMDIASDSGKLGIAWDDLAQRVMEMHVARITEAKLHLPLFDKYFLKYAIWTMRFI